MNSVYTAPQSTAAVTIDQALEQGRQLHDQAIGRSVAQLLIAFFGRRSKEDALYGRTLGHAAS